MFSFVVDYYLLVSVAAFGVIQVAACLGQLHGLVLLRSRRATWVLGLGLAVAAAAWFFGVEDRNINDYEGGLDANIQALMFFLGASTAYTATLALSSVVNRRAAAANPEPGEGLAGLRKTTFARALAHSLSYWRREWRTRILPYLSG